MVMREGNGEDNGVMVFMENPAIMQKLVKRVKKKVIYRNKIIKYNFFCYLLYKVKIINKISFKVFW